MDPYGRYRAGLEDLEEPGHNHVHSEPKVNPQVIDDLEKVKETVTPKTFPKVDPSGTDRIDGTRVEEFKGNGEIPGKSIDQQTDDVAKNILNQTKEASQPQTPSQTGTDGTQPPLEGGAAATTVAVAEPSLKDRLFSLDRYDILWGLTSSFCVSLMYSSITNFTGFYKIPMTQQKGHGRDAKIECNWMIIAIKAATFVGSTFAVVSAFTAARSWRETGSIVWIASREAYGLQGAVALGITYFRTRPTK